MSTFLDIALQLIARGWQVHPLAPKTKQPITPHGKNDASNSAAQVRAWWGKTPNANIGIACGPSQLAVLDCDYGLSCEADFIAWRDRNALPVTYTVRTGRRDSFGVQMYYAGPIPDVGAWKLDGCSGQVKSLGGYVCAAGSIHPDSGETYQVLVDAPLTPTPELVRKLQSEKQKTGKAGQPITENRNIELYSLLCKWRNDGMTEDGLTVAALQFNADMVEPPLEDEEVKRIASNAAKHDVPEPVPEVVIGSAEEKPVTDWRTRYMSEETYQNVKPPEFLIDGFLVKKSIAMLAGPVAQRKSIIALNIAHALCTGDSLFGYFHVTGGHERVVYLCPEMGAASFVKRIKQIGLGEYVGKTLFIQTMNEKPTALDDLDGELPGAVVIVDTITRFIDGDENASDDMRKFAQKVFRLVNAGASVVLLHHSKKGSSGTLDDGLRGSSELAAFVDSCWVTELEDPKEPYQSLSKMRNVKQRDFESDPFKLKPTPDSYYLSMEGDPAPEAMLKGRTNDAALDALKKLLASSPKMGVNKLQRELKALGHRKGGVWVTAERDKLSRAPIPHSVFP